MIKIATYRWWVLCWRTGNYYGLFRNRPGVQPGRWGFFILGFEVGSRNPGNKFGLWLRDIGLWPW